MRLRAPIVIAVVLTATALVGRWRARWPPWLPYVPPYAIGAVAAYWTLARLAAL